ncbi:renin receptor-like [Lingula anatina]|uniref:Renin receptor-like n=1 Tax=Lingula anatina TaxID=7574 RepID=A0A1S3HLC8_LINAN|nr:renin receptor-like [Lingula anatina]|eukprot:XP_013386266.1 renin receptor-like [Lingula anatina]
MADVVHSVAISVCLVFFLVIGCLSSSDFLVLHAPSTVQFLQDPGKLQLSEVPDVISLTYGFTVNRDLNFQGLAAGSLFKRPKANVLIAVDGFTENSPSLETKHGAKVPLDLDLPIYSTERVVNNLQSSFSPERRPFIVDLSADKSIFDLRSLSGEIFRDLPVTADKIGQLLTGKTSLLNRYEVGSLNSSRDADRTLLSELQLIEEIMSKVSKNAAQIQDNVPDFYSFAVSGYRAVVDQYGDQSEQARDAAHLISKYLEQLTDRFKALYRGSVVVEVVTLPSLRQALARKTRSLLATQVGETEEEKYNLASVYDENFPVIFNIWVWFMIFFFLGIYGIVYTMIYMDPGKDSIIYRMTATRIKKE